MRRLSQCFLNTPAMALSDLFLINLGFLLAFELRHGQLASFDQNLKAYLWSAPWISAVSLWTFYFSDLYSTWYRRTRDHILCSVFFATLLIPIFSMALTFWERRFAFPRSVLVLSFLLQLLLISAFRLSIRYVHRQALGRRPVLIVGADEQSALVLANAFLESACEWYWIAGFLPAHRLELLESRLRGVDAVLLTQQLADKGTVMARCAKLGKEALVIPSIFELSMLNAEIHQVDDTLILCARPPHLDPFKVTAKRFLDFVGAFVFGLAMSPVLLTLYVLIPFTSRGPAIFKQERVAKNGKRYMIYKFRTMVNDAESGTGPVLACDADPRVTKLGKFLRATRLDELPQLYNVFIGEMSLVGPRPEREFFVSKFCKEIPNYDFRFVVKPGITGLAQILGGYSTTAEKKLQFDLMYTCNYSVLLDLRILVQTVRIVLKGDLRKNGIRPISPSNFTPGRIDGWSADASPSHGTQERSGDDRIRAA